MAVYMGPYSKVVQKRDTSHLHWFTFTSLKNDFFEFLDWYNDLSIQLIGAKLIGNNTYAKYFRDNEDSFLYFSTIFQTSNQCSEPPFLYYTSFDHQICYAVAQGLVCCHSDHIVN